MIINCSVLTIKEKFDKLFISHLDGSCLVVKHFKTHLDLYVIEGHLLDLRNGEDGLPGGLIEGGHPAEAALVPRHVPHAQVHYGVNISVKVKPQLLQEDIFSVCLAEEVQLCLGEPLVVEERQDDAVRVCYVGLPLKTFN